MSAFTPGPWIAEDAGFSGDESTPLFAILGPEDREGKREQIATVNCEEAEANAHLITAVPGLLAACKVLHAFIPSPVVHAAGSEPLLCGTCAAIAKAEGAL